METYTRESISVESSMVKESIFGQMDLRTRVLSLKVADKVKVTGNQQKPAETYI